MKYCCDRCNKPIEENILGNTIGVTFVTVKKVFSFSSNIILCSKCGKKLDRFLNNKESD